MRVFLSYAHEDEEHRRALEEHLAFLRRTFNLELWHDRLIKPAEEWEPRISEELERADLILLLVSPSFANSEYCWGVETKRALERHRQGDALVVPILVRPVSGWSDTPLGKLQALPAEAKPVSSWGNSDEAYVSIATGLRSLIQAAPGAGVYLEPGWQDWFLVVEGAPPDFDVSRREKLASRLRRAANSEELEIRGVKPGSAKLEVRTTGAVIDSLMRLHAEGKLSEMIERPVLGIEPDLGAVIRVESRIVNGDFQSLAHFGPRDIGGRGFGDVTHPIVRGIEFPLDNPLQIGFTLFTDERFPTPAPDEVLELQGRLGRYLNTFLVLDGEHVHVNLSPTEPYCGLPTLLRNTELGRDLLAQDVVLKHYTALQLHPSTTHGKAFWDRVETLAPGTNSFESCFRVWIVPGSVSVHEKSVDGRGYVTVEKLGLEVLCDEDYETLRQYRDLHCSQPPSLRKTQDGALAAFRELILPDVQRAVAASPSFGVLRQMYSVLVMAKWIMQTEFGEALRRAGFVGSNDPVKYGLNTVADADLESMKESYLAMFADGVWQQTFMQFDSNTRSVNKRLYVAGAIELA